MFKGNALFKLKSIQCIPVYDLLSYTAPQLDN